MKAAKIIIFVIAMGTASSVLLVGVNAFTLPRIMKNEEIRIKSAVLDVLEIPYEKSGLFATFNNKVRELDIDDERFYVSAEGSAAFKFTGPGLWGPISGAASINADLKTIKTIKILHQEETPGLGARITEANFLRQFRGKEFFPDLIFVPAGRASARNEVDAITGATGSSRALEKLLNETLKKNAEKIRKEKF